MARCKDLTGAQVMVDMHSLEHLLQAIDLFARTGDSPELRRLTAPMAYRDAANPLRKLVNQYNASVELLATPPDGES